MRSKRPIWPPLVAALVMLVSGCGSEGGSLASLPVAAAEPSAGATRFVCTVHGDDGSVDLVLDLPAGFVEGPVSGGTSPRAGCTFHRPVLVPDDGNFDGDPSTQDTYQSDIVLTVADADDGRSLDHVYDDVRGDAVDGGTPEGDDSILYLERHRNVPAFGGQRGERLSFLCFCDGQNLLSRYAETDGVVVSWGSDLPLQEETDAELERILAGVTRMR